MNIIKVIKSYDKYVMLTHIILFHFSVFFLVNYICAIKREKNIFLQLFL